MGTFFSCISFPRKNRSPEEIGNAIRTALKRTGNFPGRTPFYYNAAQATPWLTLYGEAIDHFEADPVTFALYQQLRVPILFITCVDSDFMFIGLQNGRGLDFACVGTPYDCEEKPVPTLSLWEALLPTQAHQQEFSRILNSDYVFAEEALEPLGRLFGFDPDCILPPWEDAEDNPALTRV